MFTRNVSELESYSVKWWPTELIALESDTSIIPKLIESQEKFISLLKLSANNPLQIFDMIRTSGFPANLFLKHLAVLSDVGGEKLQRINKLFDDLFPINKNGERFFIYYWREKEYQHTFKTLPMKGLGNKKLFIDGVGLQSDLELNNLMIDVAMILLYGSNAKEESVAEILDKCVIGTLLGQDEQIEKFVKERYIFVSRITGGAEANSLGQIAQQYVLSYLREKLGESYNIKSNGSIIGTTFDILVENNGKFVGIEISFQVTTNSTIERKAGQAKARQIMLHENNSYIAYIIDGVGNFQRRSAISTICTYSDCTVAYSDSEFEVLLKFIKEKI